MVWKFVLATLPCFSLLAAPFDVESALKKLQEVLGNKNDDDSLTCTSHIIELPNGPLSYTAITGLMPQYDDEDDVTGHIFFTAYLKDGEEDGRPVTFIFNGGPGASSLAMHIGGLGPRRVLLPGEGQKKSPPYQLIDNPETLLDLSDLVMIDPIGTGYSRLEDPQSVNNQYSCEGDIESFGEFIRMFCASFDRWNSPKYLMGASYGTSRACGLAEELINSLGMSTKGLILLSSALDFSTLIEQRDHHLPNCLRIPTMAATAWHHGRGDQTLSLEETVEYARRFASEHYAPALFEPTRLSPYERRAFHEELARLIGLPVSTIERYQGRISEQTFVTEFFASKRQLIGAFDSRYIGPVSAIAGEYIEDPSYRDVSSTLYPSFIHYLQNELDTHIKPTKYKQSNGEVNTYWNYSTFDTIGLPNFMQRLRRTLVATPDMQVFVGSGYFDLRTPLGATEYSLDHLELPDTYRNNFQIEYYKAGHGFIFDLPSLQKFKKDMAKFYGRLYNPDPNAHDSSWKSSDRPQKTASDALRPVCH